MSPGTSNVKKAICPLISIALAIFAAALGFELWIAKRPVKPPTSDTVHAVARIEIALGRKAWAASCVASNPDVLRDMESLTGVEMHSLPRNQRQLLREVASRLAGADAGYNALFLADHHPMADYSERTILKAAAQSTTPAGTGPAARVLKEIYFGLPAISEEPMNCTE